MYENFYDKKVKKWFDFDRNELHNHYSCEDRYPFNKIFKSEKVIEEVCVKMKKDNFIGYLKTFSGYNTYLEKNEDDPIRIIEEGLK